MSTLEVEVVLMEIPWLQWLAIYLSATSIATLITGLSIASRQRRARAAGKVQDQAVWRALCGLDDRLTHLDTRLLEIEEGVHRLKEHQEAVDLRDPGEQLYQQAIRMARHGADVEELIANCGLSPGEAELVHGVYCHGTTKARSGHPPVTGCASFYEMP